MSFQRTVTSIPLEAITTKGPAKGLAEGPAEDPAVLATTPLAEARTNNRQVCTL